jgi:hypothetical protein
MTENLRKYFIRYSVELVVIFTGITLSFAFDEWRKDRDNRAEERVLLEGLSKDLKDKLEQLKSDSALIEQIKLLTTVMLTGKAKEVLDARALQRMMTDGLLGSIDFQPDAATYSVMKSTGKLGLIRNDTLRTQIIHLVESRFSALKVSYAENRNYIREQLAPLMFETLPSSEPLWSESWRLQSLTAFSSQKYQKAFLGLRLGADRLGYDVNAALLECRNVLRNINAQQAHI